MQYNFRGTYDSTQTYAVSDVVSYTIRGTTRYYYCLITNNSTSPQTPNSTDTNYWGIINVLSNFPNSVDSFISHTSLMASDQANLSRFQQLSLQSSLTSAEQDELSNLTQTLRNKLITSDDFNALQASISNMQMFLQNSVMGYIDQKQSEMQAQIDKFKDAGDYLSTSTYMKNNFVTYQGQTYLCTVDNTVNILPTNTSNWRLAAKQGSQGLQGLPGLNLVFIGTYDPTVTYATGNAVQYNGDVYYATKSSQGETPQATGVSWTIFLSRASVIVSNTAPSTVTDGTVWIDTTTNLFKYYVASSASWVATSDFGSEIGDLTTLATTTKSSLVSAINEIKNSSIKGSSSFNSTTGVVINHNIGNTNYYVLVTPTVNPNGYLGEVWVEKSNYSFKVLCSGSATTSFDYVVLISS